MAFNQRKQKTIKVEIIFEEIDGETQELSERKVIANMSQEKSLLENFQESKIPVNHSCGGNGTCGTCCIQVESDLQQLPPPNEIEKELKAERQFSEKERLSCQNFPCENLILRIRL